jgi:anaerobic ribonucleoside-triphosphate reductase activating protein
MQAGIELRDEGQHCEVGTRVMANQRPRGVFQQSASAVSTANAVSSGKAMTTIASPLTHEAAAEICERAPARAAAPRGLRVGGFVGLSASDFPGELAAVVFCQGCPWRCSYCHNPHLQSQRRTRNAFDWEVVAAKIASRRDWLDAVVFSGGEPTAQPALWDAICEVRAMGLRIGLHTAGPHPGRLEGLLPHVDWVGLDVKAPFARYDSVTRGARSGLKVLDSVCAVVESGVGYEVRTTVHPRLVSPGSLIELARSLARLGVKHYALQEFRPLGCADQALRESYSDYLDEGLCREIGEFFQAFQFRRV